jgi:hypothetical protein
MEVKKRTNLHLVENKNVENKNEGEDNNARVRVRTKKISTFILCHFPYIYLSTLFR